MRRTIRHVGGSAQNLLVNAPPGASAWGRPAPPTFVPERERRRTRRRLAWQRLVQKHAKHDRWLKRHDAYWFWTRISCTDGTTCASAQVRVRPGQEVPTIQIESLTHDDPDMAIVAEVMEEDPRVTIRVIGDGVKVVSNLMVERVRAGQTVLVPRTSARVA